MRVGFISDIHGNLFALDAVLADLERQEVDRVICLGDICFGPLAHECLERVRALDCPVILGNWDSWSIDGFPPADVHSRLSGGGGLTAGGVVSRTVTVAEQAFFLPAESVATNTTGVAVPG